VARRVRPGGGEYASLQERLAAEQRRIAARKKRDAIAEELSGLGPARVVIAGGPRRGKSTIAEKLVGPGVTHHHGEELVDRPEWAGMTREEKWSAGSALAATWLDEPGPLVAENVAMSRALRKWLKAHPEGKPVDVVVHLSDAVNETIPGQETMAAGDETVWKQIRSELVMRGVRVIDD
jgi:hypothetical protein